MHVRRRRVARSAAVDDGDPPPGAAEDEGGAQPGCAASDHNYVITCFSMAGRCRERAAATFVAVSGNGQ